MNFAASAYQNNSPRLPTSVLIVLAAIYLLAGVTGHDPWKTEDAIHIGIAHGFLTQGNWLTPYIAGEPWPHTAPLYHWVAALMGKAFGGLLGFHDAARLATTLFGALFLVALAGAARAFHGDAAGRIAPLLAMGTLGLLTPIHDAQPAIAGLAFATLAWWGGGLILQGKTLGAPLLGLGLGLAFPAHGLAGLVMAIAVLPAPIIRRNWTGLVQVLLIALPLILVWPLLLAQYAPEFWFQWWGNEIAEATTWRGLPGTRHVEQLVWATWPVLPLALWSLWLNRRQMESFAFSLLGVLIALGWYFTGSSRPLALMPLLLPLMLVAAAGASRMRRGIANAFDWFGLMTFTFAAGLIWLGASAQALDWPPKIARNFDKLAPGHAVHYPIIGLAFAAIISLAWLLSWRLRRANWRASLRWAAGTTLMWALTATLWLSWIDYAKSYRPIAQSLRTTLPQDIDCIDRAAGIDASQRASLDYFSGIRTVAPSRKRQCHWRLTIDVIDRPAPIGWIEAWRGSRPSDRKERWYLDRRAD